MKKVIIVGAGIAGLSAGIYARQSGFDVTILEMHAIPGGNSTSWKRGGYFFEGGMHWLTGQILLKTLQTFTSQGNACTHQVVCQLPLRQGAQPFNIFVGIWMSYFKVKCNKKNKDKALAIKPVPCVFKERNSLDSGTTL